MAKTRKLALLNLQAAVQNNPKWRPRYYKGLMVATAPPPPIKFFDTRTKMGLYEIREHIPRADDKYDIFHPRFERERTPRHEIFQYLIYERLEKSRSDMMAWCVTAA